ncbi:hypothetical protein RIF29_38567 [Crotalaria pallida]|uniref:Inositol-tetrakisphosphate 1-kinase N-terminal domain-containing protein n=1 Tax=Crotalaria pallida TaxID=3830 RepID=A0AAN9E0E7_CROPI
MQEERASVEQVKNAHYVAVPLVLVDVADGDLTNSEPRSSPPTTATFGAPLSLPDFLVAIRYPQGPTIDATTPDAVDTTNLPDQEGTDIVSNGMCGDSHDYRQKHPEVTVLDPPDAIQLLHIRQSMLQNVVDLNLSDCHDCFELVDLFLFMLQNLYLWMAVQSPMNYFIAFHFHLWFWHEGELDVVAVVHSYEDKVPVGSHKTRLTALNVPPMGLFYPALLVPDAYPPPPHTWSYTENILFKTIVFNALLIIGNPDGPTAHFKLSKLVLRKDLKRSFVEANEVQDEWTTYVLDELS